LNVSAHDDDIWTVAWSKNEKFNYLITGSVDDTVKTWTLFVIDCHLPILKRRDSKELLVKSRFDLHKLGVISVAIDSTGKSLLFFFSLSYALSWRFQLTGPQHQYLGPRHQRAYQDHRSRTWSSSFNFSLLIIK
jgi:hypothetical protein